MAAVASVLTDPHSSTSDAKATPPFGQEVVTLSKQAHIELVMQASYWRAQHGRAVERLDWQATQYRELLGQALQREAALHSELQTAQAKVRDLQQRLFGRKTERGSSIETRLRQGKVSSAPGVSGVRGQRPGSPGHARKRLPELPAQIEVVELDEPQCPACGSPLAAFPGTDDSEVVEIEVRAYRRIIRRHRYRPTCRCGCVPGIVAAPAPLRLIERGKFAISVWVEVLLDKFLYGHPSHRLLAELADHGLKLSAGTLTGGLQALAPLFEPLEQALLSKLRSQQHWHADETRWQVFVEVVGKVGHRWYLWVFHSPAVIHFVLDESRSAGVPVAELTAGMSPAQGGIISCDRYSAYKKFAREHPEFVLAFCWAHQRRDLLELANAHPGMQDWAMAWVARIGELYHLHAQRRRAAPGSEPYEACDHQLRYAVQRMADDRDAALVEPTLVEPALKVLQSMKNHWPGLTVFVEQPGLPMDNNAAERALRPAVVARKNFYGSGSLWSGQLAATMFSLMMTIKLHQLNPRTWLSAYLNACAAHGNRAPPDVSAFLPWAMDAQQLAAMRAAVPGGTPGIGPPNHGHGPADQPVAYDSS